MKARAILSLALIFTGAVLASAANVRTSWLMNCSECHGKDGRGRTPEGKRIKITDLSDKRVQASFTDEQAFRIIKRGLKDDDGPVMHPSDYRLTDDEIRELVQYLRKFPKR